MTTFNKYMEKSQNSESICIKPFDNDMKLMVQSANILNQFKILGFAKRGGFIGVVQENIDEFRDYKKVQRLMDFWQGRVRDTYLNEQLEQLLIQLRNE